MRLLVAVLLGCASIAPSPGQAFTAPRATPPDGPPHIVATLSARDRLFGQEGVPLEQIYLDSSDADPTNPPTAVYDITARVVVLPDGARLEAHSGLGDRVDDPRFVRQRMRGATPPALYDLAFRKRLFHGVMALRLTPIFGDVFGRTGLLTHTYMLHGRPESNGCVVFRDYPEFLKAFREGRIRRLLVVPSAGDAALRIATSAGASPGT